MKIDSLRENFKKNIFVRPLYGKVKTDNKNKRKNIFVSIGVDSCFKLRGDALDVKQQYSDKCGNKVITVKNRNNRCKESNTFLPDATENYYNINNNRLTIAKKHDLRNDVHRNIKMVGNVGSSNSHDAIERNENTNSKTIQAEIVGTSHNPDIWLRVYPLPKLPEESICSVIFRCVVCQLGLSTILVLWTLVFVFLIHSFEGPHETKVSIDFEKEQNQLVINLATELRQVTPLSPKWKTAIERRMGDERQLTILAVGRGARLHPGQFWDIPGTFLFTIYVMTALGFGAPVPQTLWGRSSGLIYALVAVPTHIYLMVNASTCLIVNLQTYSNQLKNRQKRPFTVGGNLENKKVSPNCSRNSEIAKLSSSCKVRQKFVRVRSVLCACRCVPTAAILYYVSGAVAFGVLRAKQPIEVAMFPLEFTTSGGLEHVTGYVRILYGFYVEGAMILLACSLAILRRHSSAAVLSMTEKYRLFTIDIED